MPAILLQLDEEPNRLVEIYQAAKGIKTKEEAINNLILACKDEILKKVK